MLPYYTGALSVQHTSERMTCGDRGATLEKYRVRKHADRGVAGEFFVLIYP